MFLRALDPDYLKGIATDYGLTDLGWAARPGGPDLALLGLTSVDGMPAGQLYWMPERPGRALALHILPWAGAAFALMVVLSLVILLHLGSIQYSLALSNREMRKREAELQESRTPAGRCGAPGEAGLLAPRGRRWRRQADL